MKIDRIKDYFDELFPEPKCELVYHKDYELLIAVMLSAQTTDKRVNEVTSVLFKKYPSLKALKQANIDDIIDIIRPLGTFQRKANNVVEIAKRLDDIKSVPNDRLFLESLPGVGRKTANVVLGELYNAPVIAVDTHVSRVSKRLGLAQKQDDVDIVEEKLTKKIDANLRHKTHHQFLLFGRYYCKAIAPLCDGCKLSDICKKKDVG